MKCPNSESFGKREPQCLNVCFSFRNWMLFSRPLLELVFKVWGGGGDRGV